MKQAFIEKNFKTATLTTIALANEIIEEYSDQGYILTLRQLYYQFVARDLIPNTERSYKSLGKTISDGRLAGLIDWSAIEDRTRNLAGNRHEKDPRSAIQKVRDQYAIDMWENQHCRIEVWIEKEALVGVIDRVCSKLDIDFFACRGYVSQSEQWRAGRRFAYYGQQGQDVIVLHLGDHDPSGIDMTKDNRTRLDMFSMLNCDVKRIALNMDQIDEYNPPPNPAKVTDSRFESYRLEYGEKSWELDALEPSMLDALIRKHVAKYRDEDLWAEREQEQEEDIERLDEIINELDD